MGEQYDNSKYETTKILQILLKAQKDPKKALEKFEIYILYKTHMSEILNYQITYSNHILHKN